MPASVITDIADCLGATIVGAETALGGFTPGPASVCLLDNGNTVFIKASSTELSDRAVQMHSREAEVLSSLPDGFPAPGFIASVSSGAWFVLVTEFIGGIMPSARADDETVDAVLRFVTELAAASSPCPSECVDRVGDHEAETANRWAWKKLLTEGVPHTLDAWSRRHLRSLVDLEDAWIDAAHGESLLHRDLRTDNMLLTTSGGVAVDWPVASRGAPWVDLVGLLPSFSLDGGPDPHQIFHTHPVGRRAEAAAVDCYLAALAGYFTRQALLPPPASRSQLRHFQADQGAACRRWLQKRLGWD